MNEMKKTIVISPSDSVGVALTALKKGELKRWQGILLLCIYAAFTVYQFVS